MRPELKLMAWNVNGLGDKIKRGIVLQFIKRHAPDVILLQDTHLLGNKCTALDRGGYRMESHAGFTASSRGTGIVLKKNFPLIVERTWVDKLGRYMALSGKWEGENINIVSIYVPPAMVGSTLPDIGKLLLELPTGHLIVGGDFKMMVDNQLD